MTSSLYQNRKIIHVYESIIAEHGGPPIVVLNLAREQRALGAHVTLISRDSLESEQTKQLIQEIAITPFDRICVQPKWFRLYQASSDLIKTLKQADWVQIHGVWPVLSLVIAHLCIKLNVPYVLSLHGSLRQATLKNRPWKKQLGLWILGYGSMIKHAYALHALTESEKIEAQDSGWIQANQRIFVVPNGIQLPKISQEDFHLHASLCREKGIMPTNGRYLLYLSRLHPRKNPMLLVEAFARMAHRFEDLSLVIAGRDEDGCQALVESQILEWELKLGLDLKNRIRLVGQVGGMDKWTLLHFATLFALPSLSEGFSMAILEALGSGVPVVISEGCHFKEVEDWGCGVVHGFDGAVLAEVIGGILGDEERLRGMRDKSREVSKRFGWETVVRKMESFLLI